jgi:hypothetical protein
MAGWSHYCSWLLNFDSEICNNLSLGSVKLYTLKAPAYVSVMLLGQESSRYSFFCPGPTNVKILDCSNVHAER